MNRVLLCAVFLVGSYLFSAPYANGQEGGCGGTVYEVSIVGYNNQPSSRYVFGFEATAVDYFAAICYDPEIYGYLDQICSPNGEGTLGYGHRVGYAEWIPAVVYLFSSQYHSDTNYTSLGEHYIRHWFYGTRYYLNYTGVCITTPPPSCGPTGENGPADQCPGPTPTPTPIPTPPTVQIQEVGFTTGNYTIRRWASYPNVVNITNPTWVRNDSNNANNPVAYKKGTNPTVTAKLTITPTPSRSIDTLVRIKLGGNVITTQNTAVTLTSNTVTVTGIPIRAISTQSASGLESQASVKKGTYNFDWEISFDNAQSWQSIGSSEGHIIYWTYGDVVEPSGCDTDATKRNCLFVNNLGDKDWPGLYDLALAKAIDGLDAAAQTAQTPDAIAKSLAYNIDDKIDYNPGDDSAILEHPLKAYTVGAGVQCSVNANLLRGLLRSIGINNSEAIYLWGGKPNNTTKREDEIGGKTYGYKVRTFNPNLPGSHADYYYSFQAIRPESNEGSVIVPKDPDFTFHTMVKVWDDPDNTTTNLAARYYDPSYAKRLKAHPPTYPDDYPYVNSNLRFKKAFNLDNHDQHSKDPPVLNDDTKPYVVRALRQNLCLPNGTNICPASNTIISNKIETHIATALFKTSDFDGQGVATFSVWRPSNGTWYTHDSYANSYQYSQLGQSGDKPVPGDYDGDGITDYAVFRPSDGNWYILQSDTQTLSVIHWGVATDKPVSGDFDGDGKSDTAVYRGGVWYVRRSSDGSMLAVTFGLSDDKPVSADFDGDGKTDIAVYRPQNGTWYWLRSSDGGFSSTQFGVSEDIPVTGDYDGDGKSDIAVFRPSNRVWYLLRSTEGFTSVQVGTSGDIPVPGDYDGDAKTDIALWSPSNGHWLVVNSSDGTTTEDYWGGQAFGDVAVSAAFTY